MISRRCSSLWEELIEGERSILHACKGGSLRAAVLFPSQYQVAMANLGFQVVYRILSGHPAWLVDRFFLPPPGIRLGPKEEVPSFEGHLPLSEFHLVAASISFENDLLNLVRLLEQGGIPARREERDSSHPFVLLGGIVPSANPEPFAPFADAILVGEAEESLFTFLSILEEGWDDEPRRLLERLSQVPGLYLPGLYRSLYDAFGRYVGIEPLGDFVMPIPRVTWNTFSKEGTRSCVTSSSSHFSGMDLVEVSRGCPNLCNFCMAAHLNRPVRFVERDVLFAHLQDCGDRVGLVGTSIWPPGYVVEVVEQALALGKNVSFSSLRVDAPLALFEAMRRGGVLSATLGVEAASEDRRERAGKAFSNQFLEERVLELARMGFENIKLYFMLGLPPLNLQEEVDEMVVLVKRLAHLLRSNRLGTRLSVSVASFVPKPHTPFQREPMAEREALNRAMRRAERALKSERSIAFTCELPKWSIVQGLVSRGDRLVGEVLYRVAMGESLRRALAASNCNLNYYLHRRRGPQEPLPWEIVEVDSSTGRVTSTGKVR